MNVTIKYHINGVELFAKSLKEWSDIIGDGEQMFEDYKEVAYAIAICSQMGDFTDMVTETVTFDGPAWALQ